MNFKRTFESVGLASLFAMPGLFPAFASAQEAVQHDDAIKIINRDGEAVDSAQLRNEVEIEREAKPHARRPRRIEAGATIRNGNGKITIIDDNGEKREIDVQGARSASVSHISKTVVVDGVEKREVVGKAVVVDADGVRHEYDLAPQDLAAGTEGPIPHIIPGFRGSVRAQSAKNQFMIGINCKPVSELLAAQLQLEPDTGLVVQSVGKNSPAADVGIEKHDILMFAEDRELSKIADLNEVIDKAGKEEAKVSLTIIRGGKEVGVDVGVIERPEPMQNPMAGFPELPGLHFELRQALPGIIIDRNFEAPEIMIPEIRAINEEMQEQMEQMRGQMDQLREQMKRQLDDQ